MSVPTLQLLVVATRATEAQRATARDVLPDMLDDTQAATLRAQLGETTS